LINLPTEVVDASQLISQRCLSGDESTANRESEFIITGRGGLPPSPNETLKGEAVLPAEWVTIDGSATENNSNITTKKESETPTVNLPEIVRASGWVRNANGKITLVANNNPTNASNSATNYPQCRDVSRK
jgi:large exoprotein involved in heme utilization and adhesion